MSVTVRARLPKGDTNGLAHLEQTLADTIEARPHDEDDPRCVKTVILHVEVVTGHDGDQADKAMRVVYENRTGKTELPFEDGDRE